MWDNVVRTLRTLIEGLAERMNAAQFLTPRMTREQCRTAIEGPAAVCGVSIEPALVNRLLQAMVDVILKYEGRIDRFQGDGLLAVFGVPHAHEDDPERAIRAGTSTAKQALDAVQPRIQRLLDSYWRAEEQAR